MGKYRVVFEYQNRSNGHSGLRSMAEFENEAEFEKSANRHNPNMIIIAQDISLEHALNHLALTPEIHYFTALIDDIFGLDGSPILQWEQKLKDAYDTIMSNRNRRLSKCLLWPSSGPYRDYLVDTYAEKSGRLLLCRKMLRQYVFTNDYGDITNLIMAFYYLAKEINSVLFDYKMDWLIKAE